MASIEWKKELERYCACSVGPSVLPLVLPQAACDVRLDRTLGSKCVPCGSFHNLIAEH